MSRMDDFALRQHAIHDANHESGWVGGDPKPSQEKSVTAKCCRNISTTARTWYCLVITCTPCCESWQLAVATIDPGNGRCRGGGGGGVPVEVGDGSDAITAQPQLFQPAQAVQTRDLRHPVAPQLQGPQICQPL